MIDDDKDRKDDINPFTPISDQDRVSPYNINIISSRQVMRRKKNISKGILLDPIPTSPNLNPKSGMADAPNAPPQNFNASWMNHTSIRVTWDPLPSINRRGIILGYSIFYKKVTNTQQKKGSLNNSDQEIMACAKVRTMDLVGLEKFANYCVWAEAFNSKGRGNSTSYICESASEDGKRRTIYIVCPGSVRRILVVICHHDNCRAAAVAQSAEYKLAVGSLSDKFKLTTDYSSIERLTRALKDGEVDYILVDMYLPAKRKDLFNGSWFEIAALYKAEINHGILLRGDALKLASALEEMIAYDNVQTNFLKNNDDDEGVTGLTSNKYLFFDPASPFYKKIVFAGLGILCLFTVCGLVYQIVYTKQRKRQTSERETERNKIQRELKHLLDEFYHSYRQKYETLKKKHEKEVTEVARQGRKGLGACDGKRNDVMVP
ncbi:Receptor-type tyrosine-protein phosphatase F [Stylophora pistillata]|uniref:Receptor-type tyrosine-protein phosphatase F n=1 Tax=Stylophora pistillata TaxID=50429 RepID=A0A2B4SP27_STYPI|nr:Receptor-type tyrosine-protein phosphatase F [Stylophora pistillata]